MNYIKKDTHLQSSIMCITKDASLIDVKQQTFFLKYSSTLAKIAEGCNLFDAKDIEVSKKIECYHLRLSNLLNLKWRILHFVSLLKNQNRMLPTLLWCDILLFKWCHHLWKKVSLLKIKWEETKMLKIFFIMNNVILGHSWLTLISRRNWRLFPMKILNVQK